MKGTVVVILHSEGHLMGNGAATVQHGPAGWSVDEHQERIASEEAWGNAIGNACHPDVARAVCVMVHTPHGGRQAQREHLRGSTFPSVKP